MYSTLLTLRRYAFASLLLLFAFSCSLMAADNIRADQTFDQSVMLPAPVVTYLAHEISTAYPECKQEGAIVNKAFQAKTVALNSSVQALVVKPRSSCFCSDDGCPMWVFAAASNETKLIFESPMAGLLTFTDKKSKGYPDIKVSGGLITHGYEVGYVWDGTEYQEVYNQVWVWNHERQCNEAEIEALQGGKWIKTSNVCLKF